MGGSREAAAGRGACVRVCGQPCLAAVCGRERVGALRGGLGPAMPRGWPGEGTGGQGVLVLRPTSPTEVAVLPAARDGGTDDPEQPAW